ncbi:unnamed protein product [Phytophthora fragariaefolia]|uniref:Unnamed protein product n=1 Tax=Phytophthora fragariaefolia TaxID=1490495 RepID=A0A9W7D5Z4_9STRA|nr:unnamed protein product [Phytophthora fragariaefolia]
MNPNIPRTILTKTYSDEQLEQMIMSATKKRKSKDLGNKLATEVAREFFLAETKRDPRYVAKILNVKDKRDVNWKVWKKYMQDYNKREYAYPMKPIATE